MGGRGEAGRIQDADRTFSIGLDVGRGREKVALVRLRLSRALHAAAFNGMPDPVLHLAARAMGVVTGLAALEPDPRAPGADVLLDAACRPPPACSSSWPSGA